MGVEFIIAVKNKVALKFSTPTEENLAILQYHLPLPSEKLLRHINILNLDSTQIMADVSLFLHVGFHFPSHRITIISIYI